MKSQKIRKTLIFLSFFLFPISYNYISPVMMIDGASKNIIVASTLYWLLFFVASLFIGRAACSYICPLGAGQTIVASIIGQKYKAYTRLHNAKYIIFIIWIGLFLWVAVSSGGFKHLEIMYNTEKIFSVDSVAGLIRYYVIVSIPLVFAAVFGRMGFCHYFCPFSVLSIIGSKISKAIKLPSLHIEIDSQKCIGCRKCEAACPMNNQVSSKVREGILISESCKLCGECCMACKQGVLKRRFGVTGNANIVLNGLKKIISVFIMMIILLGSSWTQIVYASSVSYKTHDFNVNDIKEFADELLPKQLEKYHIAGASISVIKDGKLLFENGYGFYDQDTRKKVSPKTTLFKIGSISKLFTWTGVMQLVEEGKINLDEDINLYLKDFKIPDTFDRPITMRNLMTHTAGFDDKLTNIFSPPDSQIIPLGIHLKDTMPKRIYPSGKIIAYSNYGAALAGFIVEQVSGQNYSDYIKENILKPLDMNNTFVEQPVPDAYRNNASLGFNFNNGFLKGHPDATTQLVPAGAISSTAEDMTKFMSVHLQNGKFRDVMILNEKTAEEMHKRQFASDERLPGICLGFMEWNRNGKRIIWHSGGSQLFKSLFMLIPEENAGLFVSYNGPDSDEARTELRQAFLDRYYPYEYKTIQPLEGYKERAKRYEGSFKEARTALYNSDKLVFALSRSKKLTASQDGSITFRNTKYVEVEPLVFSEVGGQGLLVFKENQKGEITNAFQDFEPHEAYIKLPWYMSIEIQMIIFTGCLLIFLYAVLSSFIIKRMRLKVNWYTKDENNLTLGRNLILWVCMLNLMFPVIAGLGIVFDLISNSSVLVGNIPFLTSASLFCPLVASVLSCAALIYFVYAWKNKVWSMGYRLQYTLILIASIIFILWLRYWNLIGFYS